MRGRSIYRNRKTLDEYKDEMLSFPDPEKERIEYIRNVRRNNQELSSR